jgi:hypothetical protein
MATTLRLVGLAALLAAGPAAAQPVGGWLAAFSQVRLDGSPLSLHAEAQLRHHEVAGDLDQLLLRTGLQVTPRGTRLTLTQGVGYVRAEARGEPDDAFGEVRLYQEALAPQRAGPVRLTHRARLEERWIEGQPFQTRARYALIATVPVTGDAVRRGSVYVNAFGEVFLRGPGRTQPVYDRTRLYAGVGVRATDRLGIQAGYLAQVVDGSTDHQLQLSLHHVVTF